LGRFKGEKGMKNLRASKVILSLVVFTGALTIVGNGCSRFISEPQSAASSSDNGAQALPETGAGGSDIPVIPGTKTMNTVSASQALDHFTVCSGLRKPSDNTIAAYNEKKGSMSTTGAVNTLTPAAMMSITALVGEVCNDLIDQDIASPRLFVNFNFASNSVPTDSDISKAAARLALSCWERQPDSQESSAILNMVKASVASNEVNGHRKAALLTCTTVLASLDAIIN
jgi:hypothetical protein